MMKIKNMKGLHIGRGQKFETRNKMIVDLRRLRPNEYTFSKIAKEFGITKGRAVQIHTAYKDEYKLSTD